TQIDRQDRPIHSDDRPQHLDLLVTTPITTGQTGTLGHERPPRCAHWDIKPVTPPGGRSRSQLPSLRGLSTPEEMPTPPPPLDGELRFDEATRNGRAD